MLWLESLDSDALFSRHRSPSIRLIHVVADIRRRVTEEERSGACFTRVFASPLGEKAELLDGLAAELCMLVRVVGLLAHNLSNAG